MYEMKTITLSVFEKHYTNIVFRKEKPCAGPLYVLMTSLVHCSLLRTGNEPGVIVCLLCICGACDPPCRMRRWSARASAATLLA